MKKFLIFTAIFALLSGCSWLKKDKDAEQEAAPAEQTEQAEQAPAANPAANIDMESKDSSMQLIKASLPENLAKELGTNQVPAMMVTRTAGGVERVMQMMSVKGRQEFAKDKDIGKLVNKKKQVFALVAENQDAQAAANLLLLALQNCPADSNATVLLNGDVQLPKEAVELEKKCNTKIYPPVN